MDYFCIKDFIFRKDYIKYSVTLIILFFTNYFFFRKIQKFLKRIFNLNNKFKNLLEKNSSVKEISKIKK